MRKIKCFILKFNIILRKCLLNLALMIASPRNKVILVLSQNLDKYITLEQKVLYREYNLE